VRTRAAAAQTIKETILLVDDDVKLRRILRANFEVVGYDVVDARGAEGALAALDRRRPDAIVVDVMPVESDGPSVVRRIRTHPQGTHVPLIVLAPRAHAGDAVRSLEAGADDVVTKPFAPEEMLARVRGKIKRAAEDAALQPLTKLPANGPIEAEIRRRLDASAPWSVLYADLDGFKAFNDAFGFAKGDDAIKLLARCIVGAVGKYGAGDDFVGHVGGDDFVALMHPAAAQLAADSIVAAFDRGIRGVQRDTRVPYCTVSIAIVNGSRGPSTYELISERAARVKKEAKRRRGSVVVSESELGA
jgi:diguanylate cyclase (GGDEF)-like protein